MKFLIISTVCLSYLLVICFGLKCYEASNVEINSSNLTIEECSYLHNSFCATATFRNGEVPHLKCGDDEICTSKGCTDSIHCKNPGTYKRNYPGLSYVEITITCCDTEFCNVESSAKTLYRTSFSCLFYISVFNYLYFVTL